VIPGHVSIGDVGRLVNGQGEQRWRWPEGTTEGTDAGVVPAGGRRSPQAPKKSPSSSLPPFPVRRRR